MFSSVNITFFFFFFFTVIHCKILIFLSPPQEFDLISPPEKFTNHIFFKNPVLDEVVFPSLRKLELMYWSSDGGSLRASDRVSEKLLRFKCTAPSETLSRAMIWHRVSPTLTENNNLTFDFFILPSECQNFKIFSRFMWQYKRFSLGAQTFGSHWIFF